MSTDRILVHSTIAPQFIDRLKAAFSANANSSQPAPTLVSSAARARVQSAVSEALSSGAQPIYGNASSEPPENTGIRTTPLILGNVNDDTALWQDENFASLAACKIVRDDDEAIEAANKTSYGLSASIFTEDLRKGFAIAKRLESG